MWLLTWQEEGDVDKGKAQLLEQTINICAGRLVSEDLFSHREYKNLSTLTNRLCHQLVAFQDHKVTSSYTVLIYHRNICCRSFLKELMHNIPYLNLDLDLNLNLNLKYSIRHIFE